METKDLKNHFFSIGEKFNFQKKYDVLYRESSECLLLLQLQKSNYSFLYYLRIKIFVQGVHYKNFEFNKEITKKSGHILTGLPSKYLEAFNLENSLCDLERLSMMQKLFKEYDELFFKQMLSVEGVLNYKKSYPEFEFNPLIEKELLRISTQN